MKIIRIFGRSFKDAFRSFFRNFSLSLASISCSAITLIIVAIAILFSFNVNNITANIEDVLTIVVFVNRDATDEQTTSLGNQIYSMDNVDTEKSKFNTKDEIKESLSNDESIKSVLDTLDENPLQSTYVIKVKDVSKISETAEEIKGFENVTSVKYGESLVNKLISMFDVIRNACYVAVILLIVVTAFLIANTIKITIFSRRQEINIMRLVGTSNTVIKMPFLIEGLLLGIVGAILPVLLTIFGYTFFYDYVGGSLFTQLVILVEPATIVYKTSIVLVLVGGIVGMFGSLNAVRKYLKI
ncbi:MAG TPA: permease-like cell division protein FtsX [Bacilli bacterium]|jgi:cell division transport system permease protein|nr:permease-like cell division protein FtsX [Bacilli bacterium]HPZ23727.1 permease-like cell division protein FtsX [Bacilli bacterium]HQC83764.1 permease-like cell division protein FtsX [Bacilli bacterium]